jgi:hypothetical protein
LACQCPISGSRHVHSANHCGGYVHPGHNQLAWGSSYDSGGNIHSTYDCMAGWGSHVQRNVEPDDKLYQRWYSGRNHFRGGVLNGYNTLHCCVERIILFAQYIERSHPSQRNYEQHTFNAGNIRRIGSCGTHSHPDAIGHSCLARRRSNK